MIVNEWPSKKTDDCSRHPIQRDIIINPIFYLHVVGDFSSTSESFRRSHSTFCMTLGPPLLINGSVIILLGFFCLLAFLIFQILSYVIKYCLIIMILSKSCWFCNKACNCCHFMAKEWIQIGDGIIALSLLFCIWRWPAENYFICRLSIIQN